ncbi:MAG: acyl-CoA dehydrogenase family protein [Azospirillaceae bacterium]|nr:acyl-CoA dehydrogenase family protein [Azospirillaceae bacterium]
MSFPAVADLLPDAFEPVRAAWRETASRHVAPAAAAIDRDERIGPEVVAALRAAGAFASGFPAAYGGLADPGDGPAAQMLRHGLMHEALGTASASVQGLVNVHHMGGSAIARWGTADQKREWLPLLTAGTRLAAIAITEPEVGSNAAAVKTWAAPDGDGYVVDGHKKWITCGQSADLFVLIAGSDAGPVAFILPRETPGLEIRPITGMLGCRGYMMAELVLDRCRLGTELMLGRPGFGVSHVASIGLDAGRYNLAWGCVGLAGACLAASLDYARHRQQFGKPIGEHQLVQRLIAHMATDIEASRLLCWHAGIRRGMGHEHAARDTVTAKYHASTMVNRAASDALQIHGAQGCGPELALERYFRDARITEVIEGTTQILEGVIARHYYQAVPR